MAALQFEASRRIVFLALHFASLLLSSAARAQTSPIIVTGDPVPLRTATDSLIYLDNYAVNSLGQAAFYGKTASGAHGIWLTRQGDTQLISQTGDSVPLLNEQFDYSDEDETGLNLSRSGAVLINTELHDDRRTDGLRARRKRF